MSEKIVILEGSEINTGQETGTGYEGEQHSEKALEKIERAWPEVMKRLRRIVERDTGASAGGFAVDTVQFGISIEAGFNFVIAGTGSADATITFKRSGAKSG